LGEIGRRVPDVSGRLAREAVQTSTRVRRAVLWALGWIGDEASVKRLTRSVADETSSFNIGLALIGIARAKGEGAFEALKAELKRESHRDMLRVLIFDAMARLRDQRALPILLEHTQPRFRNEAREAATKALGKLGILSSEVERRLEELVSDPWFRVRSAAAGSLRRLKSSRAEAAIREALRTEPLDGVRCALEKALADGRPG